MFFAWINYKELQPIHYFSWSYCSWNSLSSGLDLSFEPRKPIVQLPSGIVSTPWHWHHKLFGCWPFWPGATAVLACMTESSTVLLWKTHKSRIWEFIYSKCLYFFCNFISNSFILWNSRLNQSSLRPVRYHPVVFYHWILPLKPSSTWVQTSSAFGILFYLEVCSLFKFWNFKVIWLNVCLPSPMGHFNLQIHVLWYLMFFLYNLSGNTSHFFFFPLHYWNAFSLFKCNFSIYLVFTFFMILSERFAQIYFPHLLFQIYLLFHVFSLLTSFQKVFSSIPQIFIKCLL